MEWYINKNGQQVTEGTNLYKISTSYSKGGYNFYTSKPESRGYYVYFNLNVERDGGWEKVAIMDGKGWKVCLKTVNRASAKVETEINRSVENAISEVAKIAAFEMSDEWKSEEIGRIFLAIKAA